jgi:hypothetical protein
MRTMDVMTGLDTETNPPDLISAVARTILQKNLSE